MHGPADNDKTFFQPPLPLYPALCMKLFEGLAYSCWNLSSSPVLSSSMCFSPFFYFPQPVPSAYIICLSRVQHGYIICYLIPYSVCTLHMYSGECGTHWWVSYLELVQERSPFCLSSNELWIRWTERVKQTDRYSLGIYGTSFQGISNNWFFF